MPEEIPVPAQYLLHLFGIMCGMLQKVCDVQVGMMATLDTQVYQLLQQLPPQVHLLSSVSAPLTIFDVGKIILLMLTRMSPHVCDDA